MLKTSARALDTGGNGLKDFRKTRRKRIEAWLTAAMFLFGTLTGCGSVSDTHGDVGTPNDGKLKVVTTLFPYYDFTRQIAGDAVDLSMVIPAGQDSHSFEPTPADIRLIQNADLLICNGGAMEPGCGIPGFGELKGHHDDGLCGYRGGRDRGRHGGRR